MSLTDALLLDPYKFHVWISVRTDGGTTQCGSGTIADPYQVATSTDFDALMNGLSEGTTVHLGPTTGTYQFLTKGYADGVAGGWTPKKGMRIIGSGVDVTVLKLEGGATTAKLYFAVGHPFGAATQVDFFEISDLTIDCNLTGLADASVASGAVRVMGNHTLVRRVKTKNWGTKVNTVDAFVFSVITANLDATSNKELANTGIANCIAVDPAGTGTTNGKVTVFYAASKINPGISESYGNGPYIRNCFVDCNNPNQSCEFRGLWMSSCRGGVVEGNQIHNTKLAVYLEGASARDFTLRSNWFRNVAFGAFMNLGGLNPSSPDTSNTLERLGGTLPNSTVAKFTRGAGHGLAEGDRVRIDVASGSALYEGIFVVKSVVSTTGFHYQMTGDPGGTAPTGATMQKVYGAANLLIEANIIELAVDSVGQWGVQIYDANPSLQTPDYVHGQVVVRENKIRYLDGKLEPGYSGMAIKVEGAKSLFVRDNVIESAPTNPNPIQHNRCGSVSYFNNRTPAGVLIQGYSGGKESDELETDADDALLLALY